MALPKGLLPLLFINKIIFDLVQLFIHIVLKYFFNLVLFVLIFHKIIFVNRTILGLLGLVILDGRDPFLLGFFTELIQHLLVVVNFVGERVFAAVMYDHFAKAHRVRKSLDQVFVILVNSFHLKIQISFFFLVTPDLGLQLLDFPVSNLEFRFVEVV